MGNCFSKTVDERPLPRPFRSEQPQFNQDVDDFARRTGEVVGAPRSDSLPDKLPPKCSDLVIGIDFGTTFTGVAWAHGASFSPAMSTAEMQQAADNVYVIKTWPNQTNAFAEKVPTVLAYNNDPPMWGATVKPTDKPQVAHFKLGLQEDLGEHYQLHELRPELIAESPLSGYLSDHNWNHPDLPGLKAVDHAGNYLTRIVEYITKEEFPKRFGPKFLKNQKISYIITVPAIWSDKAKEQTKQAAITAGIEENDLELITEPEAAALYCATLCEEVDLEQGDRFLICDAGGGTVVYSLLNHETLI